MKLGGIEVPDAVWEALREHNLVIFAGAGVSMAPPANLPDFRGLAEEVSRRTDGSFSDEEREEDFFGRLKDKKINVHEKVREIFSERNPKPTETHKNILRLYPKDGVRIVTTNFDLLFECAAQEAFSTEVNIETFDAPALPSGKRFNGIVHVHGSVSHCDEMVLTDRDVGRAYLPEGYSRRFLVDLFNKFTVLFIGYSHDDPLMVYMARALSSSEKQCFILTCEKNLEHWKMLGVTPIWYEKSGTGGHDAVDKLIRRSADLVEYSILDWRQEIGDIAKNPPPRLDGEKASLIKIAFGYEAKIRFFTREAASPDWIKWLDEHDYLDALFRGNELGDRELEICKWLVEKFALMHSDCLFSLIGEHHMCLNLIFWYELGLEIGWQEKNQMDKEVLLKWVSILLSTMSSNMNISARAQILWGLGKQCNRYELLNDLLRIFDSMMASQLVPHDIGGISPRPFNVLPLGEYHSLNEVWEEMLKPKIEHIADTVLSRTVHHLEERYFLLKPWGKAKRGGDIDSRRRLTIESDEEDKHRYPVNVLIDATRDCLEFLASEKPEEAMRWCNKLVPSDAPLLRRLAVHAFFKIENIPTDEKVDWLLGNVGLYDKPVKNEALQAIKQAYSDTGQQRRKNIVEAISHGSEEEQHDWLYRLFHAAPDYEIAKEALDRLREKYPELRERKYIDFIRSMKTEGEQVQSSWTAERLLEKPLEEQFPYLLTFQGELGFGRRGLVLAVQEAAKSDPAWGIGLAKILDEAKEWGSDLWGGLIEAWAEVALDEASHSEVLSWLSKSELHLKHPLEVAQALRALVENGGTPYAFKLLPQANRIAKTLWSRLDKSEKIPEEMPLNGWLGSAINRPAGEITLFWLMSFSVWRKNQESPPERMSNEYRDMLSEIVHDCSLAGKLGRTVLASQFHFLLAVDREWTKGNILPLFDSGDGFQAAWDGFLTWAHLTPDTAEVLNDVFLKAVQKIGNGFIPQEKRFVEFYAAMLGNFVEDRKKWIANLFDYGDEETKRHFVFVIRDRLLHQRHQKNSDQQREYWQHWLKEYWENRLDNIPAQLSSQESEEMLGWLPFLESVFPEAVDLACRMPLGRLEDVEAMHDLEDEDELINGYPEAMAKLMIGLGDCPMSSYVRGQVSKIIEKIPQEKISSETKQKLRELKAKLGLD